MTAQTAAIIPAEFAPAAIEILKAMADNAPLPGWFDTLLAAASDGMRRHQGLPQKEADHRAKAAAAGTLWFAMRDNLTDAESQRFLSILTKWVMA